MYRSFSKWYVAQGEYRVTVRDEAGDAGRALKVVERHQGFLPGEPW